MAPVYLFLLDVQILIRYRRNGVREEMGSGLDVVTAFEDGASEMNDSELLNRASELGRVLFTQDDDLLVEAATRQRMGDFLMV
jgi:predicted nuclease of predicted toxin-antitoxin system